MTARKRLAMVGVAVAAAAAGAAPAQASVDSMVAAGPGGAARFLWSDGTPGQVRTRTLSGGALGDAQAVSPVNRDSFGGSIGTDADGDSVAVWASRTDAVWSVRARTVTAEGALTPVQTLSPAGVGASAPKLAVEPDGDSVITWTRQGSTYNVVQARRRAADGTLGPILNVSYAAGNAQDPDVAIAADGTATVAWLRRATATSFYAQTRTISPAGVLGATRDLSSTAEPVSPPHVHVSEAGTAVIAWIRTAGGALVYRTRTAGGTLGTPVTVTGPHGPTGGVATSNSLRTASNAGGRTVFTWQEFNGFGYANRGRVRSSTGVLGPIFDLGGPGLSPLPAAVDPDGNLTFVWIAPAEGGNAIYSRRRTVSGTLGEVRTVSAVGPGLLPDLPHVAVDGGGKATVAWGEMLGGTRARTITAGGTMSPVFDLNNG